VAFSLKYLSTIKSFSHLLPFKESIRNRLTSKVRRYILNDSKLSLEIGSPIFDQGFVDYAELHQCGTLRIYGWSLQATSKLKNSIHISRDGHVQSSRLYRCYRPDIATHYHRESMYLGFVYESFLTHGNVNSLQIMAHGITDPIIFPVPKSFNIQEPHYSMLRDNEEIYHREHIYSSGLPVDLVDPQVIAALRNVKGSSLDFGCGKGALIRHLRSRGVDAFGIELDRKEISESIPTDIRNYIKLYDGSFPLPFENGSFDYVTCIEVLEHVKAYEEMLREIARVVRKKVLLSVPDMSAVPILAKHQVVPWHLLEASHFNFFSQASLENLLNDYFGNINFLRVGPVNINGTIYNTSLLASCSKL